MLEDIPAILEDPVDASDELLDAEIMKQLVIVGFPGRKVPDEVLR